MDFFLRKGVDFIEHFNFKNDAGKDIALPSGVFKLYLVRGSFAREYTVGAGLVRNRNSIVWKITKEQSQDFEYSTLYYTLYLDDTELVRGVLKVQ